jgi:hypothetical protein
MTCINPYDVVSCTYLSRVRKLILSGDCIQTFLSILSNFEVDTFIIIIIIIIDILCTDLPQYK